MGTGNLPQGRFSAAIGNRGCHSGWVSPRPVFGRGPAGLVEAIWEAPPQAFYSGCPENLF